jgi:hypothetical protein
MFELEDVNTEELLFKKNKFVQYQDISSRATLVLFK